MSNFEVSIKYDLCNVCEDCLDACKEDVFGLDEEDYKIVVFNEANCNGCEACVEICLPEAIHVCESLEKMKADQENAKEKRKNRESNLQRLLQEHEKDEHGYHKIPLSEMLHALDFRNGEELENWFIFKDGYVVYVKDDKVVVLIYD